MLRNFDRTRSRQQTSSGRSRLVIRADKKNKTPFEDIKGFKWKWEKPKDVGYAGLGSDVR
eukprot:3757752-Pyramimonas_sp.AAC.2